MLEGKYEKLEFQKVLRFTPCKIEKWAKTKKWKKGTKRNGELKENDEER